MTTNCKLKFLDYNIYRTYFVILHDFSSQVGQVTPSPNLSDLEKSEGCPSAIFPSDHLPIISDVLLGERSAS